MKKLIVALVFTALLVSTAFALENMKLSVNTNTTVTVYGYGIVKHHPNLAIVSLSVETQDESCYKAVEDNAEITKRLQENLKIFGNVTTEYYRVYPVYKDDEISGYRVVHSLRIECDPNDVGKVIDRAVELGANRVNSIKFTFSDDLKEKLYAEALKEAMDDAFQKAYVVAGSLNAKSVEPKDVEVLQHYVPYPIEYRVVGTPITPDQVEVVASVKVVYQLT